jgi:type I restriction enzyme S subunit
MTQQELKNSILQEAIEGRLVPQDPNDEPASVLLDKIRKEKAKLVKEKKIKADKNESHIYRTEDGHWMEHFEDKKREDVCIDDEIPFNIPQGWEWVRWGMLGDYKKGPFGSSLTKSMFVPKSDEAVKVYEQKNAIQKDYSLGDYYISKQKYEAMKGFTVYPGDIIVSCAGTIGETYLLPKDAPEGIINQALMRARLHLNSITAYWLLNFRYILLIENKLKGAGSAIKNIPPFEVLKAMPVPLPPLAEQKRIVEKIEELLPKVEEYGKAQESLDKLNEELPERLKKSILQEAIEGRLVPQDPNDEPASVLLDKIRKEKARLVKEGNLKKKDLEEIAVEEDEIPQQIIEGWEYVKLPFVTNLIDGTKREGEFVCLDAKFLRGKSAGEKLSKGKFVHQNDNIILVDGENSGEVFTVPCDGYMGSTFKQLWVTGVLYLPYVLYFIKANKDLLRNSKKGAAIPHLNKDVFYNLVIGIPPLAEQKRIVEKIEQLMHEIDKLKV